MAAKQNALLKKYRQFSLQSFLELKDPMARPTQPLVMSAMKYLELNDTDVRAYHADVMARIRMTQQDYMVSK